MNTDTDNLATVAQDLIKKCAAESAAEIAKVTVPFYGFQDDEVKRDRTGVLYRIADHHFILTAAHDLLEIIQSQIPLYIPPTEPDQDPIHLLNCRFHGTEKGGRDVAVIRLTDRVVRDLPPRFEFLGHNRIDLCDEGKDGLYLLFGYPQEWPDVPKEGIHHSKAMVFASRPYTGERNPDAFFAADVHIALTFDRNAIDLDARSDYRLPDPTGISGCGLWRAADWSSLADGTWSLKELRLVALQHRWFKKRNYVQGTWIKYALQLVVDNYPGLRQPMSLIYPR
ncbi:MAG: hypothetical protein ACYSWU_08820 [Planctomycetota bacterium]|jgi:hypothetical protein